MEQTDKKKYSKPEIRIVELESSAILTGSDEFPGYSGPLGAKGNNFDWEEEY